MRRLVWVEGIVWGQQDKRTWMYPISQKMARVAEWIMGGEGTLTKLSRSSGIKS